MQTPISITIVCVENNAPNVAPNNSSVFVRNRTIRKAASNKEISICKHVSDMIIPNRFLSEAP